MTDEQRAHELALEIAKMWFEANKDNLETDGDGAKIVPIDKICSTYQAAFDLFTKG
jgi:hypothetical protein